MTKDKYAKDEENREEHTTMMGILLEVKEDVGYMRGKIDTMEKTNNDWWSRMLAGFALWIAWFKGA